MANLTFMEALTKALSRVKQYVDDNMIILEDDGLELEGMVGNTFPDLTTENKTLLGAINEVNAQADENSELLDITSETLNQTLDNILNSNSKDGE